MKELEQKLNEFNRRYKIGHLGFLHEDDGTVLPTILNSEAWIVGERIVALFEGKRGCYLTDRFVPLK